MIRERKTDPATAPFEYLSRILAHNRSANEPELSHLQRPPRIRLSTHHPFYLIMILIIVL